MIYELYWYEQQVYDELSHWWGGGQQCVMTAYSGSIARPFGHEETTFQKTKIIRVMNCSRQTDCFSLGQYL